MEKNVTTLQDKPMKSIIKHQAQSCIVLALCAGIFFGCQCSPSKPKADPLVGWTFKPFPGWELPPYGHNTNHIDNAITENYQAFIKEHQLNIFGSITGFFENDAGQHAIKFTAFPPGENATWDYVLIYDKSNKRIKVLRYNYARYQS